MQFDLGDVIATRTLRLDGKDTIMLSIGRPVAEPGGTVFCYYQITGVGSGRVRRAGGIDDIQALTLALKIAAADLYASDEGKAGRITWLGEKDLGLPVPDVIKPFVPRG
jgi:hypothetical protein